MRDPNSAPATQRHVIYLVLISISPENSKKITAAKSFFFIKVGKVREI